MKFNMISGADFSPQCGIVDSVLPCRVHGFVVRVDAVRSGGGGIVEVKNSE